jgi:DNA polymerase II small subunit/DNA polymerase delta subunit B
VLRGSYRTDKLNKSVYSDIAQVMETFESFLDKLSETIDVDIMPGELDFSNSFMP